MGKTVSKLYMQGLWVGLAFSITTFVGCQQECLDTCEFVNEVKIDTFSLNQWDSIWLAGGRDVVQMFEDTSGQLYEMEVVQLDTFYTTSDRFIPCGDCGDSIRNIRFTPIVRYVMANGTDSFVLDLKANVFITDTNLLFKCVEGVAEFSTSGGTAVMDFIAGCNVPLDTARVIRYNKQFYNATFYNQADTLICPIDSGQIVDEFPTVEIEQMRLSTDGPLAGFRRNGRCYTYTGFRPK